MLALLSFSAQVQTPSAKALGIGELVLAVIITGIVVGFLSLVGLKRRSGGKP